MSRILTTANESFSRPDRVVIQDRRATVIDYKTGQRNANHASQIKRYGKALEKWVRVTKQYHRLLMMKSFEKRYNTIRCTEKFKHIYKKNWNK